MRVCKKELTNLTIKNILKNNFMVTYTIIYISIGFIFSSLMYYFIKDDIDLAKRWLILLNILFFYPFLIVILLFNFILLQIFPDK